MFGVFRKVLLEAGSEVGYKLSLPGVAVMLAFALIQGPATGRVEGLKRFQLVALKDRKLWAIRDNHIRPGPEDAPPHDGFLTRDARIMANEETG